MKCRYCGNPIAADAKKCPSCLWEGDDLAIDDTPKEETVKEETAQEEAQNQEQEQEIKDDPFESAFVGNDAPNEEPQNDESKNEEATQNNIVFGLSKREFFDFYIPDKIRSNTLWAVYLLFFSAIVNCYSALYDFYFGIVCSVACLVLAIAINKTLSIGPAIGSCVFTIILTIVNFVMTQTISGWLAIAASVFCCSALNKFNSMWTIYNATSKVPVLDAMDASRAQARRLKKKSNVGWIVYYAVLAVCILGAVAQYVVALSYISKFTYGETDGNRYTNEFYSIDMTLDSEWDIFDKAELADANEEMYWISDPTEVDTQYVLYAMTEEDEGISIESFYLESMLYSGEDIASEYEDAYSSQTDFLERIADVEHNGKRYEGIYMEYTYSDVDENGNEIEIVCYQKMFVRVEGSYCVTIIIFTDESAERLDEICAMALGEAE